MMQQIGTVSALFRYPVKALRGEALTEARVERTGFVGDRQRALVVQSPDHARTGKTYRGKEHRRLHTVVSVDAAEELALGAGVSVAIDATQPHYFDAEPVSIVFDTWIRDLEMLAGRAVDPLQFRPNIIAAAAPGFVAAEAALIGAQLTIGAVTFAVVSSITRCVTISYDLATGDPDVALQRTIVQQRGNQMGVYCRVLVPGSIVSGAAIVSATGTPA